MGKSFNQGSHTVTATKDAKISKSGLNANNCEIVFKKEEGFSLSWKPGADIQQFEEIKKGDKLEIRLLKKSTLNNFALDAKV